jgi:hypothetical protein
VLIIRRALERSFCKMADPEKRKLNLVSNGVKPFDCLALRHASIVKNWFDFCERFHQRRGVKENLNTIIPGFRLIDCKSRHFIHATSDCDYVSLSYVWGHKPSEPSKQQFISDKLPNQVPLVIEDAITVAT